MTQFTAAQLSGGTLFYHHWNLVTAVQIPGITGRFSGRYFMNFEESSKTNIVKVAKFPNQLPGLAADGGENRSDHLTE